MTSCVRFLAKRPRFLLIVFMLSGISQGKFLDRGLCLNICSRPFDHSKPCSIRPYSVNYSCLILVLLHESFPPACYIPVDKSPKMGCLLLKPKMWPSTSTEQYNPRFFKEKRRKSEITQDPDSELERSLIWSDFKVLFYLCPGCLRTESWGEGSGMRERNVPGEPRKLRKAELQTIITQLIIPRRMRCCAT
jgi:hypothetical protein